MVKRAGQHAVDDRKAPIDDRDGLRQMLLSWLGERTCQDIGATASTGRHDQLDWPVFSVGDINADLIKRDV